jgi:Flp pilus assembly protein CpaB
VTPTRHVSTTDLELFAIGGLSSEGTAALETHVRSCAACAALLQREARVELAIGSVALAQRAASAAPKAMARPWRRRAFAAGSAAGVALLFAAIGLSAGQPFAITGPQQSVMAAAHDLAAGATLTADDLTSVQIALALSPRHAAAADRPDQWIGRRLSAPLAKGEVLVVSLTGPGTATSIGATVPKGFRAVAFPCLGADTVAAGDHVDVIAWVKAAGQEPVATVLVENVVVSEDPVEHAGDEEGALRDVTLQLRPEDVAAVSQAAHAGTLSLALRNPLDVGPAKGSGRAQFEDLFSPDHRSALQKARKAAAASKETK